MMTTFKDWIDKQGWAARTSYEYGYWYDKWLGFTGNNIGSNDNALQDSVNAFCEAYNNNVSRAMVKNYLIYVDKNYIKLPRNRGRKGRKLPKVITYDEAKRLWEWCDNNGHRREGLLVRFLFETGLRITETLNTTPTNINLTKKSTRSVGKGGKEHIQFISKETAERLAHTIKARQLDKDDRIFNISRHTAKKNIAAYSKLVLGKSISPHVLRHSCATYLLEKTKDLVMVNKYLDHSKIETTAIYLHIAKGEIEKSVRGVFDE